MTVKWNGERRELNKIEMYWKRNSCGIDLRNAHANNKLSSV